MKEVILGYGLPVMKTYRTSNEIKVSKDVHSLVKLWNDTFLYYPQPFRTENRTNSRKPIYNISVLYSTSGEQKALRIAHLHHYYLCNCPHNPCKWLNHYQD